MTAWYEESFGYEYLDLYAHRDGAEARADIEAIVRLVDPPRDEPLLDLCCGACRHVLVLRDLGFTQIVGLDLSEQLLEVGSVQLGQADDEQACSEVDLVCSDMREIPYREHFATVLSLFTSFGYFAADDENRRVLDAVHAALRPGGRFLLDYLNRERVIAHLVPHDENRIEGRHVGNLRRITPDGRRVEKATTVTLPSGESRRFHESVRMYSRDEMVEMLRQAGFAAVECFGSLDGQPYALDSERLILLARKGSA